MNGMDALGAFRCHVKDNVRILEGIRVTAGHHHIVALAHLCENLLSEVLGVLAVVRIILVKVGVQIGSESRNRNSVCVVIHI